MRLLAQAAQARADLALGADRVEGVGRGLDPLGRRQGVQRRPRLQAQVRADERVIEAYFGGGKYEERA